MNYISEINAFYDWVQINPLAPGAQALWHVLMQINNKCAVNVNDTWCWKTEFTVPNIKLLSILAFSRQQLDRMRNILIQTGRIVYKRGKGNQSGIYKMIPFDSEIVENTVDKLWITPSKCFVSHNVTHPVTQTVTQTVTQSGHKADTNPDLCNIIGTLDNIYNNYNNIIYNNISCGVGDDACVREENAFSEIFSSVDSYIGVTPKIKGQVSEIAHEIFSKCCTRLPSQQDCVKVFERIHRKEVTGTGTPVIEIDEEKTKILGYAFLQATLAGHANWAYVDGVLANLRQRGLNTFDMCENYDINREIAKNER